MTELKALVILTMIPHLGSAKIRTLIKAYGSALAALNVPFKEIEKLEKFSSIFPHWDNRKRDSQWKENLEIADRQGAKLIPFESPEYPSALKKMTDPPTLLYTQGSLNQADLNGIAVVGSSHPSPYGSEMAQTFGACLAKKGFLVVSGLAKGIDTADHRGALQTGRTLAVLGSGLANIYPQENQELAREIVANGAVISEYPTKASPDPSHFPQRKRIVSGLNRGALLIEASLNSGSMLTMKKSDQYKKTLYLSRSAD